VTCVTDDGQVPIVINKAVNEHDVHLVVMGMHGNAGLSGFMLGNHSRRMIDDAICPLLLVPAKAPVAPVKKIAFATDFKQPEKDLDAIYGLVPMLKMLDAELLLTHIHERVDRAWGFKENIQNYLVELSNKANYSRIYYRMVESESPEKGLQWLSEHGEVDMMAMVHRRHSFLDSILNGSHTQKLAKALSIPLLVIPGK
ncbi:MAG: universal stress protein, partial [Bacteroidetes bacterium]|nr:universal stress protein [Bacteroidota bacterium]